MSVLIIFIKLIAVFDLLVIAVYFGGDILSTMLNKLRRKPKQDDPFDFSLDTVTVSLSIDSIRQLCSDDAADFVEEKILPNAENNGRFDGTRTDGDSSALIRFDRFSCSRSSYG